MAGQSNKSEGVVGEFRTTLTWRRETPDFTYDGYDRTHTVAFSGGTTLAMSAAPEFRGNASLVNPEEQLLAALSSCHMLTFLAIAARSRMVVDSYVDHATAVLAKNAAGRLAVTEATLRPEIKFGGERIPTEAEIVRLHEKSHQQCFIANSVVTRVLIEPVNRLPDRGTSPSSS